MGERNGNPLQYSCLENPRRLRCPQGHIESDTTEATWHACMHWRKMATHSSILARESQGQRSLVGCLLWGRTDSDTTESN